MVQAGDESIMLGHWRIALRQAEEAARAGRLDEAIALVRRADVADHRQAAQMLGRLLADLVARARRRVDAGDVAGSMDDLDLAERSGSPPDAVAGGRKAVAEAALADLAVDLDAGEPGPVVDRCDALASRGVAGPDLRRIREAAEAWRVALAEARKGEFARASEAIDRAGRLLGATAAAAIAATRGDLDARRIEAHPRVDRLYAALAAGAWPETLAAAEATLEVVPEHPAARHARVAAWQHVGGLAPSGSLNGKPARLSAADRPAPAPIAARRGPAAPAIGRDGPAVPRAPRFEVAPTGPPEADDAPPQAVDPRFLLWADAVGGYLVLTAPEARIGRAEPGGRVDIPLLGDLARDHATLIRDGDGYLVRARRPTFVNNREVAGEATLRDGDLIRLGSTVELEFRQPSPVSATARLRLTSRHRLPIAVDGIILLDETCIMGPSRQAHIPAPNLDGPVVLYRRAGGLGCRAPGPFEVDGRPTVGRAPLGPRSNVVGSGFSFSLEPAASLG